MIVDKLLKNNLISPPSWLQTNVIYETRIGSVSYGVESSSSDIDLMGVVVPPKGIVWPHLTGAIPGFGTQPKGFDQYMKHHIPMDNIVYDVVVYNIVKYFDLTMKANPNMLDSLFVRSNMITHMSEAGQWIRDNRRNFLSKQCYPKLRGYAYAQLTKLKKDVETEKRNPKRQADVDQFGYDTKFAYHIVRLVLQCQQILIEHNLDLMANTAILKSVRNGEWSLGKLYDWFDNMEIVLENDRNKSTLRAFPSEAIIKGILLNTLEAHYGTLDDFVKTTEDTALHRLVNQFVKDIKSL